MSAGAGGVTERIDINDPNWVQKIAPKRSLLPVVRPLPSGMILALPTSSPHGWPVLMLPHQITPEDWNQMMDILAAMKPGIVAEHDEEAEKEPRK